MISSRLNSFVIITCFLALYPFANIQAFDGKRKGFFLGVGTGAGVSVGSVGGSYLYGKPAFTLDYKIGYATSEQLLIYLTLRSALDGGYSYNYFNEGQFRHNNLDFYTDGTYGLGFMLFPSRDNNLYFSGCFGLAATVDLGYFLTDAIGFGISGGVGYEIFPNLAADLTLDYRRLTYIGGYETFDAIFSYYEVFEDPPDHLVTLSLAFNFLFY